MGGIIGQGQVTNGATQSSDKWAKLAVVRKRLSNSADQRNRLKPSLANSRFAPSCDTTADNVRVKPVARPARQRCWMEVRIVIRGRKKLNGGQREVCSC